MAEVTWTEIAGATYDRDQEEIWYTDEKVGDGKRQWSVKTICTFFLEGVQVFHDGWDVRDSHEAHEGTAEEDTVDEGLNG